MKYMFLVVCVMLGLALSILASIIANGRIPFASEAAEKPVEVKVASPAPPTKNAATVFSSQEQAVNELIAALKKEKEKYESKTRELTEKEAQLQQQKDIMSQLETEVKGLQDKLQAKIIEMASAESTNFRRLADVYSKMDPASASNLLEQMEPDRAARVLSMVPERQAAAILDATVAKGEKGAAVAGKWSDAMRRLKTDKKGS